MSHTVDLVVDSLETIEAYFYNEFSHHLENTNFKKNKNFFERILSYRKQKLKYRKIIESSQYDVRFKWLSVGVLCETIKNATRFDNLYNNLADEESKCIFNWYIKSKVGYSILGHGLTGKAFPPPVNNGEYRAMEAKIKKTEQNKIYNIDGLKIESDYMMTIVDTWQFGQYKIDGIISPEVGDIVFDIGAFHGETSLWFAKNVGDEGKVYCFEPFPDNIFQLKKNKTKNALSNMIIVPAGVSDKIGYEKMTGSGPGATIGDSQSADTFIEVITLDSYIENEGLNHVDFIKMDIEGSEMLALKGFTKINKFKPKLAISAYHLKDDLFIIYEFIKSISQNYQVYLRHRKPNLSETMIFATI